MIEARDSEVFFPEEGFFSPSHIERSKGKKVCALDLDDVLADSIPGWVAFANLQMTGLFSEAKLGFGHWANVDYDDLYDLKKGVPYYYYRLLKEMYRQSFVKENLPLVDGAKELVSYLKEEEYKIVVMTKRSDRSASITYKWLWRNLSSPSGNATVDEVVYNKNKHVEILLRYPSLDFMVEDNRDITNIVGMWGYSVYLLDNQYNQGELNENVIRVKSLVDIIKDLDNKDFLAGKL